MKLELTTDRKAFEAEVRDFLDKALPRDISGMKKVFHCCSSTRIVPGCGEKTTRPLMASAPRNCTYIRLRFQLRRYLARKALTGQHCSCWSVLTVWDQGSCDRKVFAGTTIGCLI
jgi:hypothetical protein